MRRLLATGVAGLAIAAPLAGCGGSDDEGGTTNKAAPGAEVAPPALAAPDRRAYDEIERSSGVLRAAVVAGDLNAAARKLARAKPRDPLLRRLRRAALVALRTAASEGTLEGASAKQVAKSAIGEADRMDAGLRRYAASHPAANG
jgi:hypothetical protein